MACRDTPPSALPRNLYAPFSHASPHLNPGIQHHTCVHTQQSHSMKSTDLLSMLHSRVAVLEEKLANANAHMDSAEISNRYLLHLLSAGNVVTGLDGASAEEVSKLRHKLLVSKLEKNRLKAELQDALLICHSPTPWACHCCRTQAHTQSDGSSTAIGCQPTRIARQMNLHLLDSTGPLTESLIDLGEFEASTSAEGTPELDQLDDQSDDQSSVSDDSEELPHSTRHGSHYTQSWGLGGTKHIGVKSVEIFPEESSYVRHFLSGSGNEDCLSTVPSKARVLSPFHQTEEYTLTSNRMIPHTSSPLILGWHIRLSRFPISSPARLP